MIKDDVENRGKRTVSGEHPAAPWMVMHAVSVINRGRKDEEGFSACRRWRGRDLKKPAAEFGERVLRAPVMSASTDKFDVGWMDGLRLGIRVGSQSQERQTE